MVANAFWYYEAMKFIIIGISYNWTKVDCYESF